MTLWTNQDPLRTIWERTLMRLQALEKDAYCRQSWQEYEELNRQKWHHLGMKSPFYEKEGSK